MKKILFILFGLFILSLTSCATGIVDEAYYSNVEIVYIEHRPYYLHGGRYLPYGHHHPAPYGSAVVRLPHPRPTITVRERSHIRPQGPRMHNTQPRRNEPRRSNGRR